MTVRHPVRCSLHPLLLAALAVAVPQVHAQRKLTLEEAARPGATVRFAPETPRVDWGPGGLVRIRQGRGPEARSDWFDPRTKAAVSAPSAAGDAGPEAGGPRRNAPGGRAPGSGVAVRDGDVYVVPAGKERPVRLTETGGCEQAHRAPAGERISFVRGKNLVVMELADRSEWAVTTDGGEELFYGVLDWVYQEEIYGRGDFQGHWWSPDGQRIAFLRLDESPVKPFTVVDHVPEPRLDTERGVVAEVTPYPKAGDPNPVAGLGVADVATRTVRWIDLGDYDPGILIVNVGWSPDGSRVVFQVQDRIQTWLDLDVADPSTGEVKRLLREESDTWVDVLGAPRWLADGSFLWHSERTGYENVYHYAADGRLITAVTDVEWPVLSVLRLDEERGLLWFEGRGESPIDRHVFRVGLDGEGLVQLTQGAGTHRVRLDATGDYFLDECSAVDVLPEIRLCSADGEVLHTWQSEPSAEMLEYALAPRELVTIPARDDFPLDATVIVPAATAGGARHAVFVDTYSGPDAPSVRNSFSVSAWHQFLQQNGVLVLQVNVRSASGRGQVTAGTCYQQFGVRELEDLEDAVAWVCANRGGDPERVGISGWSYGGFMAAYALTHSTAFRLGIAGAGVYDWQLYDTIYTERYMSTPQLNPDGYRKSSVLAAAKDLHGHLVLLHGTMDDNVHLQNAIRLVYELQMAGKDFDFMVYPKSRHGVRMPEQRWHMQRLIWRAIEQHLLAGGTVRAG